jgi:hypothetical protein
MIKCGSAKIREEKNGMRCTVIMIFVSRTGSTSAQLWSVNSTAIVHLSFEVCIFRLPMLGVNRFRRFDFVDPL